jgi:hypothetical protein
MRRAALIRSCVQQSTSLLFAVTSRTVPTIVEDTLKKNKDRVMIFLRPRLAYDNKGYATGGSGNAASPANCDEWLAAMRRMRSRTPHIKRDTATTQVPPDGNCTVSARAVEVFLKSSSQITRYRLLMSVRACGC